MSNFRMRMYFLYKMDNVHEKCYLKEVYIMLDRIPIRKDRPHLPYISFYLTSSSCLFEGISVESRAHSSRK